MILAPFTPQLAAEGAMVLGPLLGIVAAAPPADRALAVPMVPAAPEPPRLIFTGWKDDASRLRMYRIGHARSLQVAAAARGRIARGEAWQRQTHEWALSRCREYRAEIARLSAQAGEVPTP